MSTAKQPQHFEPTRTIPLRGEQEDMQALEPATIAPENFAPSALAKGIIHSNNVYARAVHDRHSAQR